MDLDWAEIGKTIASIMPVIIFLLINIIFRKQQEQKRKITVVQGLLSETIYNQKLMEAFLLQWQFKKFRTSIWRRNKNKLDYMDSGLRDNLGGAYEIAEEFNQEIAEAKKHKSPNYLASVQWHRLRTPLAGSKQGLEEWLLLNKGKEKPSQRRRNLLKL